MVYFPQRGMLQAKRRYFATPEAATDEVLKWSKDRKPDAVLGKRAVDDVLWAQSLLPPGITIRDAIRFYVEHHSAATSASKLTLKEVTDIIEADLLRMKKSKSYRANINGSAARINKALGKDTQVSMLTKATLIRFIRDGAEYWDRFGRKRIASLVCSKAVELEIFKHSPLLGWKFETQPKKSVHFLSNEDAQVILDYFFDSYPDYLPAVALQLFAGIRTEELAREDEGGRNGKRALRWEDLVWGTRISIANEVSKTGEGRIIEFWPEALTNFLTPFRKTTGRILAMPKSVEAAKFNFGSDKSHILEDLNSARVKEGLAPVDFRQNDFRHTFATNLAATQGIVVTQTCLGHSNHQMIKRYKNGLRMKEPSVAFFAMKPTRIIDNVIAMTA